MKRAYRWPGYVALLMLLVLLAACSGARSSAEQQPASATMTPGTGDPVAGEQLFRRTLELTGQPACITCHVVDAGEPPIVGPPLVGIATTARTRTQNQPPEVYLYNSIVDPNAYIVSGYNAGLMPRLYGFYLSQQQINDLVTYMMTLEQPAN